MTDFFKWLSSNPIATTTLIVSFGTVVVAVTLLYVVAFFQGRSISFWPPNIGEPPTKSARLKTGHGVKTTQPLSRTNPDAGGPENADALDSEPEPIIKIGTKLKTASGDTVTIESNFYAGAAATLFRAKNSNTRLMVKLYWRGLMPGSTAWDAFNREYRATEILTHRNIVKVMDRGLIGGYPYVVMEFLPGGTLRDLLGSHYRVPGLEILSIAGQIADALDYAHSHGVIHRDVKPGNVLFESDSHGRVALSDFGIAQILGAVERDMTAQGGEFVGSPGYLAPEAFEGDEVHASSDIYSFGVVLFEMIAGQIPFGENLSTFAILRAKVDEDAPDIREFRKVPESIALRLAQTLSRIQDARPKTARAVLSGIESDIGSL